MKGLVAATQFRGKRDPCTNHLSPLLNLTCLGLSRSSNVHLAAWISFFAMSVLGHLRCRTFVGPSSQGLEGVLELLSKCRDNLGNCRCFCGNFCDLWDKATSCWYFALISLNWFANNEWEATSLSVPSPFPCPALGPASCTFCVWHVPHSHHSRGFHAVVQ